MASGAVELVFPLRDVSGSNNGSGQTPELFHYVNGPVKVPGPWKRGRPKGTVTKRRKDPDTENRAPVVLEFVNTSAESRDIDKLARTKIRRHARRQGHPTNPPDLKQAHAQSQAVVARGSQPQSSPRAICGLDFQRQLSGVDPFAVAPIRLEPYMLDLLSYFQHNRWGYLYSLEKAAGFNPIVDHWFPLAFRDAALLHSIIGCADVYTSGYETVTAGSRGLMHLQAAITLTNRRLALCEPTRQSGVIPVISGIAMLEKGAGRHENWRIHMAGLKQVVSLCGGIESFSSDAMTLGKIHRADLYGALDGVQLPYFKGPPLPPLPSGLPLPSPGFQAIDDSVGLNDTMRSCITHLEGITHSWFSKVKPLPIDAMQTRDMMTSIEYALVSTQHRHGDTRDYETAELLRIALVLYCWTILGEHPPSTSVGGELSNTFRNLFTNWAAPPVAEHYLEEPPSRQKSLPLDFILWAIFLAASVVRAKESHKVCAEMGWLLATFSSLSSSQQAGFNNWDNLKARLSRFLWVPSVHDASLQWLWTETEDMRRDAMLSAA